MPALLPNALVLEGFPLQYLTKVFALEEEGEACAHACRENRASNSLEPRAPKRGKVRETGRRERRPWGTERVSYKISFSRRRRLAGI